MSSALMDQNQLTLRSMGFQLLYLAEDQSAWSQATFGTDREKSPVGTLKHLAKEANEAIASFDVEQWQRDGTVSDDCQTELADCLILLLDASRRAGMTPLDLIRKAQAKMEVNKTRKWNKPQGDEPTEHVRDGE